MTGAPMKMPDGRSLAQWIADSEKTANVSNAHKRSAGTRKSRKAARRAEKGWVTGEHNFKQQQWVEEEDVEIQALLRVGARRRNRWFNERLLRELAGPMDAQDMSAQYTPPPFGVPAPPSIIATAIEHGRQELLLHLSMDEEMDMISRQDAPSQSAVMFQSADIFQRTVAAWSRVLPRARHALRREALLPVLFGLERRLLEYMDAAQDAEDAAMEDVGVQDDEGLLFRLPDAFQRMLLHGLCDFYNLRCHSW
eukprot:CAMPEP_0118929900 /NCGR_PEP_ID=MMETSP1169-20130426/6768_1 /TAXON_ID=36882 /ORGANISM="Pyramimonas obovata, Strain CCMP722" /LENGTH=251 /DNA_ID=CAMNT_0006872173 /DNA_START=228 /DNA_END=980 /DNA_ORIENTATION=-